MAVFRPQRIIFTPPAIQEMPGKIFIEGQAHDATTLAPLFNQALPMSVQWSALGGSNTMPLFALGSRFWQIGTSVANSRTSCSPTDASLNDAGQSKMSYSYQLSNVPNTLVIGPASYSSSNTGTTQFYNTSTLMPAGLGAPVSFDSAQPTFPLAFAEIGNTVYHLSAQNNNGPSVSGAFKIISTNTSTFASAVLSAFGVGAAMGMMTEVHESPTNVYFYNPLPVAIAAGTTHTLYTFDKTTAVTTARGTSPARPVAAGGPSYFPSHAVSTGTNTRATFNAEIAATTGSQLNFVVCAFDVTTPATAPVWTTVTPSGATGMLGTLTQNTYLTMRTWAFNVGATTYICVGTLDMSSSGSGLGLQTYVIHVYKCATATPTSISYCSSIMLSQALYTKAIMPTDSTFANLIVPTSGSVEFYSWNQSTESYSKSSTLAIVPASIAIDQTGRIWINENNVSKAAGLHVLSPTISSNITVNFDNTALTYAGTVINANLIVDAYNYLGARTANNVTIQLDSNSCTFADGTTTKTVTTLTSGDLLVPIKVVSAGYVRVIANLSI